MIEAALVIDRWDNWARGHVTGQNATIGAYESTMHVLVREGALVLLHGWLFDRRCECRYNLSAL